MNDEELLDILEGFGDAYHEYVQGAKTCGDDIVCMNFWANQYGQAKDYAVKEIKDFFGVSLNQEDTQQ